MGVKRPFEEENLPELSFEQRIEDHNNKKLSFTTEDFLSTPAPRFHSPDDASIVDKELTPSAPAPLSLVASSSGEEDSGNIRGYVDLRTPLLPPVQFEDPYIYLLNTPPRKEIPVGPDHQAEVPEWDPIASRKYLSDHNENSYDEREQELMGSCIVRTPWLNGSSSDGFAVGRGRTDCSCMDVASMRCVQQHVKEAREKLQETIGDEIFVKLGFYDMGEEVSRKWTPGDEQVFHEVVFSNPASHGRDFWKLLTSVFPSRTKKELVSYYFNVFMLRRRAVQNRSFMLQIDSDDDEEHKSAHELFGQNNSLLSHNSDDDENDPRITPEEYFYVVKEEGEDSEVESFDDGDLDVGWVDGYGSEPENVGGDVCKDDGVGKETKSD